MGRKNRRNTQYKKFKRHDPNPDLTRQYRTKYTVTKEKLEIFLATGRPYEVTFLVSEYSNGITRSDIRTVLARTPTEAKLKATQFYTKTTPKIIMVCPTKDNWENLTERQQ